MPTSTETNVTARTVERCCHGRPIGWAWGRCGVCKPIADVSAMAVGERDPDPGPEKW